MYTLKDGGITIPISLSYHASGIRVSELATWVGLGWVLNAGGIITRTVMGAPDEGSKKSPSGIGNMSGYYRNYGISNLPRLPDQTNWSTQGSSWNWYYAPDIANCKVDGEPDIYTFNFNGHVGKFIFDENRTAHTLEDDNLKITANFNNAFNSFTIITDFQEF